MLIRRRSLSLSFVFAFFLAGLAPQTVFAQTATTYPDPAALRTRMGEIFRQRLADYNGIRGSAAANRTPSSTSHPRTGRAWHSTEHLVPGDSAFIEQTPAGTYKYASSLVYDASWEVAGALFKKWMDDILPAAYPGVAIRRYTRDNYMYLFNVTVPEGSDSLTVTFVLRPVRAETWEARVEIGTPRETGRLNYCHPDDLAAMIAKEGKPAAGNGTIAKGAEPVTAPASGLSVKEFWPIVDNELMDKQAEPGNYTGYGSLYFTSGDSYRGNFVNGKMEGNGSYTFSNGDFYFGGFSNNQFSGVGQMKKKNGYSYAGRFSANTPVDGAVETNDPAYGPSRVTSGGSSSSGSGSFSNGNSYSGSRSGTCSNCSGKGSVQVQTGACSSCRGTGRNGGRYVKDAYNGSSKWEHMGCSACGGSGYNTTWKTCGACSGAGRN